jgi:hypothetical protein
MSFYFAQNVQMWLPNKALFDLDAIMQSRPPVTMKKAQ